MLWDDASRFETLWPTCFGQKRTFPALLSSAFLMDQAVSKPGLRGRVDAMCCYCIYDPEEKGIFLIR